MGLFSKPTVRFGTIDGKVSDIPDGQAWGLMWQSVPAPGNVGFYRVERTVDGGRVMQSIQSVDEQVKAESERVRTEEREKGQQAASAQFDLGKQQGITEGRGESSTAGAAVTPSGQPPDESWF